MHTTGPSANDHPLLARLPVAPGAVCLRPLRVADVDDFLVYRSDPEVARYQGWQPTEHDAALACLHDAASPPRREGDWAQIGFSLARHAQGRGWALVAVRACIDQLLMPLGMTRLRGITDARSTASLRLLARLGFVHCASEGVVFRGEACTEITLKKLL